MAVAEAEAQQPVSAQVVGNAFVAQYYHIQHQSPWLVHRFYQDISKLGRPEVDGSMSITTTMQAINEKIVSLNYGDFKAEIKSVDAQESFSGGVHVLVTGYMTGLQNSVRNFAQSFFLAPQDKGYFVLNDMFRYLDNASVNPALVNDVVAPATPEPILAVPAPAQENHVSEESTPPTEEAVVGEVYNPPENGDAPIVEEEIPVAEVVDEVEDDTQMVVESSAKIEEMPKKSYASIVKHLKESVAVPTPRQTVPRIAPPKIVEQQANSTVATITDGPISSSESVDNGNNQDSEAEGYSVYIKGLPMNASEAMLEEVFKKFGSIKNDGVQVRSTKQTAFCFGFVEFEEASAMQKALEASPVTIGGRQAFVEEKRSTYSRGNSKGRFQSGRGSGFRNDGVRGRGNYGGGRGYNRGGDFNGRGDFGNRGGDFNDRGDFGNRGGDFNGRGDSGNRGGDFNGRGDFGNRGGNRGGPTNRDGYQRSESMNNNGGRMNRTGVMTYGNAKNMTPRVSATA